MMTNSNKTTFSDQDILHNIMFIIKTFLHALTLNYQKIIKN